MDPVAWEQDTRLRERASRAPAGFEPEQPLPFWSQRYPGDTGA
jgi:hypothetical protein